MDLKSLISLDLWQLFSWQPTASQGLATYSEQDWSHWIQLGARGHSVVEDSPCCAMSEKQGEVVMVGSVCQTLRLNSVYTYFQVTLQQSKVQFVGIWPVVWMKHTKGHKSLTCQLLGGLYEMNWLTLICRNPHQKTTSQLILLFSVLHTFTLRSNLDSRDSELETSIHLNEDCLEHNTCLKAH